MHKHVVLHKCETIFNNAKYYKLNTCMREEIEVDPKRLMVRKA